MRMDFGPVTMILDDGFEDGENGRKLATALAEACSLESHKRCCVDASGGDSSADQLR